MRKALTTGLCFISVLLVATSLSSCAYRFTNLAMAPPPGIETIAVEAVFDTSKKVLPHEWLWEALHRKIAENGRLVLTSRDKADALLRAHLTTAESGPVGSPNTVGKQKDPTGPITPGTNFEEFRDLSIAGLYTTKERLNFTVVVEVWNLRTREVIMSRSYSDGGDFLSFRPDDKAHKNTGFLLFEEAFERRFREASYRVADQVVRDLLL